ncbi:hypothetical protein QIS99_05050 [Streptomyces sp. B-S-A8]|uniref:PPM-type phosphatase domain-containing protein n=1 Tax=Streptomyces solicavernae TaxID=3043614 RepID=A0ABT6RMI6_9ACTN|nr:hypothetical protein [Streptomyces sp. B-S-A8]MDI3385585.1 hypothetical protein [Streptomyces sp. B-S-A8]
MTHHAVRLLPWSSPEGKPCYLIGDGTGSSHVSRVADNVESVQLDMADELLDHAAEMRADEEVTRAQLNFLVDCMTHSLRDVCRIAVSRGDRLRAAAFDGDGSMRDPGRADPQCGI